MSTSTIENPKIVSRDEWLAARKRLLAKEKRFTREGDALAAERRQLLWVKVEKNYVFDSSGGKKTLADLFDGRNQLIVYHFMFGPEWTKAAPVARSTWITRMVSWCTWRNVTFPSQRFHEHPCPKSNRLKSAWAGGLHGSRRSEPTSTTTTALRSPRRRWPRGKVDYNFDLVEFPSAEAPGINIFYKDKTGTIFHTYSAYARETEDVMNTYNYLDLVPKGRDEDGLPFTMSWVRHHDRYADGYLADADKPYWPADAVAAR
jgi:predicted dithiol-disulfide oxidoreductase (DUF899 family)